jgi:hypothetical protein
MRRCLRQITVVQDRGLLLPALTTRQARGLEGLGATVYEDHRKPDGRGWVTMADPEGNLFCVERSAAERV